MDVLTERELWELFAVAVVRRVCFALAALACLGLAGWWWLA